jgi:hypothetical protein
MALALGDEILKNGIFQKFLFLELIFEFLDLSRPSPKTIN